MEAKLRLVVERVSVAARNPVPVNEAVCAPALSLIVKLPVAAPAWEGTKVIVYEQDVPAARPPPQVRAVSLKGAVST